MACLLAERGVRLLDRVSVPLDVPQQLFRVAAEPSLLRLDHLVHVLLVDARRELLDQVRLGVEQQLFHGAE